MIKDSDILEANDYYLLWEACLKFHNKSFNYKLIACKLGIFQVFKSLSKDRIFLIIFWGTEAGWLWKGKRRERQTIKVL